MVESSLADHSDVSLFEGTAVFRVLINSATELSSFKYFSSSLVVLKQRGSF